MDTVFYESKSSRVLPLEEKTITTINNRLLVPPFLAWIKEHVMEYTFENFIETANFYIQKKLTKVQVIEHLNFAYNYIGIDPLSIIELFGILDKHGIYEKIITTSASKVLNNGEKELLW